MHVWTQAFYWVKYYIQIFHSKRKKKKSKQKWIFLVAKKHILVLVNTQLCLTIYIKKIIYPVPGSTDPTSTNSFAQNDANKKPTKGPIIVAVCRQPRIWKGENTQNQNPDIIIFLKLL